MLEVDFEILTLIIASRAILILTKNRSLLCNGNPMNSSYLLLSSGDGRGGWGWVAVSGIRIPPFF